MRHCMALHRRPIQKFWPTSHHRKKENEHLSDRFDDYEMHVQDEKGGTSRRGRRDSRAEWLLPCVALARTTKRGRDKRNACKKTVMAKWVLDTCITVQNGIMDEFTFPPILLVPACLLLGWCGEGSHMSNNPFSLHLSRAKILGSHAILINIKNGFDMKKNALDMGC